MLLGGHIKKDLVIDDFKVNIVENNLHLFNNKALISYKIKKEK